MVAKTTGVVFAVSGGLCVGKEGPLVHTGAILAALFSHLPKIPALFGEKSILSRILKHFREDHFKRNFVSGGAACGVAAAFGAPIGGVLFALEEASSFWSLQLTWTVFFCAMVSTFTYNILITSYRGNVLEVNDPGLISFGSVAHNPYRLFELPIFAIIAAIGGM